VACHQAALRIIAATGIGTDDDGFELKLNQK
jgi:hypothetical protein